MMTATKPLTSNKLEALMEVVAIFTGSYTVESLQTWKRVSFLRKSRALDL